MKYEAVTWEGALIGPETLDKLVDDNAIKGQKPGDFGIKGRVRDEMLEAWAEARAQWALFSTRRGREDAKDLYGTSRTRQSWIIPFLSLLGYELENAPAAEAAGKSFPISHRAAGRVCPVHIVGFTESLDKKREGARSSPHSMVQEYVNLSDTLFGLVTNGLGFRLLRDSSRLIKLSYLEFNLERIFEEELFPDFALLFRLLHISRWPLANPDGSPAGQASDCLLETYHQDSLENGSRIREKLSDAVINAITLWANGLLAHPDNGAFRASFASDATAPRRFYDALLTLVYRILFLLVIEERGLTHPPDADAALKSVYRDYYSLSALRGRSRGIAREEGRYCDLWQCLRDCFRLYEDAGLAETLGLKPLGGDLFSSESLRLFDGLSLDNRTFAEGFQLLDSYGDDTRGVRVRVNYAALNVEEFGSIYEGLLDYDARVTAVGAGLSFSFQKGSDRAKSGSHYTPEELVQPLIEHALQPLIESCLHEANAEDKLLSLKICDDACGSGHILLNAARRIALEVARLRTKADNPDPSSYRKALRDVIERCVYGVDFNPQALRLCKVALWLEGHNPGQSLGFLDHHLKCGDSLVGLTRADDLLAGIAEEAFTARDGDDKDFAAALRKRHKNERAESASKQNLLDRQSEVGDSLKTVIETLSTVTRMDDSTPEAAMHKKETYLLVTQGSAWRRLKALADIQLAPFFVPKKPDCAVATEQEYRAFLDGRDDTEKHPISEMAAEVSESRRFFHWFLEFAEVMQDGGFDCFLGNPPFLGNRKLRGSFGLDYLDYLKYAYAPAGAIDLIGYFVRRNYSLLKPERAMGTLATNTIAQGGTREGGLDVIEKEGGSIVMAVRSRPWPGAAAVEVSLAAIYKGAWTGNRVLDGKQVDFISTYFDDQKGVGNPFPLAANAGKSFQGSIVLGPGFVLESANALSLITHNPRNKDVLFPYLNGEDLNSRSDQSPSRWVINFQDWPLDQASAPDGYDGPVAADYPMCLEIIERLVKPERTRVDAKGSFVLRKPLPERWWHYADKRPALYRTIAPLERVIVVARVSRTLAFAFSTQAIVLDEKLIVIAKADSRYLSLLQSSMHFAWSWKYCTTMKADLTYTPTTQFQTFPFPAGFEPNAPQATTPSDIGNRLDSLGARLDSDRRGVMTRINVGQTTLYNIYHDPDLSVAAVMKEAKCNEESASWAVEKIVALRDLHRSIDEAVRDAYGWTDLDLQHGFHELEFLPENDRIRYTVSTAARKEILRGLLALNHERHAEEVAAGLVDENGKLLKKRGAEAPSDKAEKKKPKKAVFGERALF
ncbi:MAG: Eco57I restriction-modification methylase domain-containing protein [Spirochaetia bacterium]